MPSIPDTLCKGGVLSLPQTIKDADIPGAAPEELIESFRPWIYKIAKRYNERLKSTGACDMEDLFQAGCIALLQAQKTYDPDAGASFTTYSFYYLRSAIRRELGLQKDNEPVTISLDSAAYNEDPDGLTLEETIPDTSSETPEEYAERMLLYDQLHKAVNGLKGANCSSVLDMVYLHDMPRKDAAEALGISYKALTQCESKGLRMLRQNMPLQRMYAPNFSTGLGKYRQTFTSAVEEQVLWREAVLGESSRGQEDDEEPDVL